MATAASEPPMVEQVITEFFAKSLHIILESRSPYESSRNFTRPSPPSSPLSSSQPRDRWFNLALRDCPAALENFDLWRQSNLEPLVIDIVLLHRNNTSTTSAGAGKIIERWVIQYATRKSGSGNDNDSNNNGRKPRNSSAVDHSLYWSTYQGSTVLLRSLYLVVRLLPAYNIFRDLTSSGRICPLNLSHTISFVEPFAGAEDTGMKRYAFSQIETLFGRLSLSVSYVPVLEVVAAPEPTTTMPMELIIDYIGSPTTVFLKKFNSLPSQCSFRADFSDREDQVTNQDAGGSLTGTPAADVEALVRMLKTAPGLRESLPSIAAPLVPQEPSSVQRVMTEEHGNVTSSSAVVPSLLGSRTELKKYKEIRESILNRVKTQPQDTELGEKPTNGDP